MSSTRPTTGDGPSTHSYCRIRLWLGLDRYAQACGPLGGDSLNYAYDASKGWKWLPEAGVWAYIVEPDGDTERDLTAMVLIEDGTLATTYELDGTEVATFHISRYEVTWREWQAVQEWGEATGFEWPSSVGRGCADDISSIPSIGSTPLNGATQRARWKA